MLWIMKFVNIKFRRLKLYELLPTFNTHVDVVDTVC